MNNYIIKVLKKEEKHRAELHTHTHTYKVCVCGGGGELKRKQIAWMGCGPWSLH